MERRAREIKSYRGNKTGKFEINRTEGNAGAAKVERVVINECRTSRAFFPLCSQEDAM